MIKSTLPKSRFLRNESGVTIVFVALMLVIFVAFTALAVDIAHLYVVKNELQNAADAGALAGARCLYDCDAAILPGQQVNLNANQIAYDAATANKSENVMVEVDSHLTNSGDVQRGHWSFGSRTFTPSDSTMPPILYEKTTAELDADLSFVNAVKVRTRRESTQATSFFAGILGFMGFNVTAEAVAYLGFAGSLEPTAVDLPIAICSRSILQDGKYTCSVARMLNSGSNLCTFNTGGWTDYSQPTPCVGSADVQFLKDILPTTSQCTDTTNPAGLVFGTLTNVQPGVVNPVFEGLKKCWLTKSANASIPWETTLPVIDCQSNNVDTCSSLIGAVTVKILWINDNNDKIEDFPASASGWTAKADEDTGIKRWDSFVTHFNIQNGCGGLALYSDNPQENGYQNKNVYFAPECTPHEPAGTTGGQNFGILAKRPVLVG